MKLYEIAMFDHGSQKIEVPQYVYHLTLDRNLNSIVVNGIRTGRGNANYQFKRPGVFCITNIGDSDAIEQISAMVVTAGLPDGEAHDGEVVVIRVDTLKVQITDWFVDPLHEFKYATNSHAVWTPDPIPASACKVIGKVDMMDMKVVPLA